MENTLIMNKLPFPKEFDGNQWNTVFRPTRKFIPKYLHQDLPELKLQWIKQQFKEIGKFNCPRLEFFNDSIRRHASHKNDKEKSKSHRISSIKDYQCLKEELQYALLMCDKDSPILDRLVSEARKVQQPKMKDILRPNRYFQGTIDLVFKNRKNLYKSQLNRPHEQKVSQQKSEIIDKIPLLPLIK